MSELFYRTVRAIGSAIFHLASAPRVLHADRLPARGGYLLAQPAQEVTVADILRPLSSDLFGDRWLENENGPAVQTFRRALNAAIAVLSDARLSDLMQAQDAARAAQTYMMHI